MVEKSKRKLTSVLILLLLLTQSSTYGQSFLGKLENLTVMNIFNFIPVFGQAADGAGSIGVSYDSIYVSLLVLTLILLGIIFLLAFIFVNLNNLVRIKEGKEAYTLSGTFANTLRLLKNRYVAVAGNFVLILVLGTFLVKNARGVGLHQGYMPEQPIKYSHELHAGKLQIDCQYCHTGASKGKSAWIPSANVCMNCHGVIKEGPKYGSEEIAKVIAAYENNEPIEWVRIHNIPDHAYFNHQQHVVAGGLECQTCHGPVEEMEEVYQYSELSMGWCVNCHRETEVNLELYEKMGVELEEGTTAADRGAINCARCHY